VHQQETIDTTVSLPHGLSVMDARDNHKQSRTKLPELPTNNTLGSIVYEYLSTIKFITIKVILITDSSFVAYHKYNYGFVLFGI